jgi:hypothetical protein
LLPSNQPLMDNGSSKNSKTLDIEMLLKCNNYPSS